MDGKGCPSDHFRSSIALVREPVSPPAGRGSGRDDDALVAALLTGEIGDLITPMTSHLSPAEQKRLATLLTRMLG